MLLRRLNKQAVITPVAASMKLQRFVGADCHVGSRVRSERGSVDMRRAVVRQMKKPIEKRTIRPIREPLDMFNPKMTGIGSMKIARSVRRFEIAFDQLEGMSVIVSHTLKGNIPVPEEVDACSRYRSIIDARYRRALEDADYDI